MNNDPRNQCNPYLTHNKLHYLLKDLGMSTAERASVLRACRVLSCDNEPNLQAPAFSAYGTGAALRLKTLKQLIEDPCSWIHNKLKDDELQACHTFLERREAAPPPRTPAPSRWGSGRPALFNFGGINPAPHVPSGRWA